LAVFQRRIKHAVIKLFPCRKTDSKNGQSSTEKCPPNY
jgi:hypothetical protein